MISRERHELGGVAPELTQLEGLAVRQLHHQPHVNIVEKTFHRVAHKTDGCSSTAERLRPQGHGTTS